MTQELAAPDPATTAVFREIVFSRRSIRGFLPDPMPHAVLNAVLEEAQQTPSNCNTQPWHVHIVSGAALERLGEALLQAMRTNHMSPDFSFDTGAYPEPYRARATDQGRSYYQALGIAREDAEKRTEVVERNVRFFGAPHVALLFTPTVGDDVRVAADVGMYAQTFLLALTARGYAGVPQAVLSYFASTVREMLGVPEAFKLLFGISFGLPDPAQETYHYRQSRVNADQAVFMHS